MIILSFLNFVITLICFKIFCISPILSLSLFRRSEIPSKDDFPLIRADITNNIGYSSVEFK